MGAAARQFFCHEAATAPEIQYGQSRPSWKRPVEYAEAGRRQALEQSKPARLAAPPLRCEVSVHGLSVVVFCGDGQDSGGDARKPIWRRLFIGEELSPKE